MTPVNDDPVLLDINNISLTDPDVVEIMFENLTQEEWNNFTLLAEDKDIEGGFVTAPQLYNLDSDPGERVNLADRYPELVRELDAEANRIAADTYR